jgi:hypothetical protein
MSIYSTAMPLGYIERLKNKMSAPLTVAETVRPSQKRPKGRKATQLVAKPERPRRPIKHPVQYHFTISLAMNESVTRLTKNNPTMTPSSLGRAALHIYLMGNDPQYVAALSNGQSNAT